MNTFGNHSVESHEYIFRLNRFLIESDLFGVHRKAYLYLRTISRVMS